MAPRPDFDRATGVDEGVAIDVRPRSDKDSRVGIRCEKHDAAIQRHAIFQGDRTMVSRDLDRTKGDVAFNVKSMGTVESDPQP